MYPWPNLNDGEALCLAWLSNYFKLFDEGVIISIIYTLNLMPA